MTPPVQFCFQCQPMTLWTTAHFTNSGWAHDWNLIKKTFHSHFIFSDLIRSQFYTCHNSWAVVTCAKLWPDQSISFHARATSNFIDFIIWAHKLLMTCDPGKPPCNCMQWDVCIFLASLGKIGNHVCLFLKTWMLNISMNRKCIANVTNKCVTYNL